MTDIIFEESAGLRSVDYFCKDEFITLKIFDEYAAFTCFWTPNQPPLNALQKLLRIRIIPVDVSKGSVELINQKFDTDDLEEALEKLLALPSSDILALNFGTDTRTVALERSKNEEYGLCCGIGGEFGLLDKLGTALIFTASESLVKQYYAMRMRLIGSEFQTT